MELTNFIALSVIVALVLGIGLGTMTWAYFGKGSISVLFKEPILTYPELRLISQESTAKQKINLPAL
jgi:hypothetical protein